MKPRRTSVGRGKRAGNGGEDELRQAVLAELEPSGPIEGYLADCIAQALSTLTASPDDPFALVARRDLFENLRELRSLQAHRKQAAA